MNEYEAWLRYARDDLRVAGWAMEGEVFSQVCFHAQQCIEKSIKALLVNAGAVPPKTHRLVVLMDLLRGADFEALMPMIRFLDQIYMPSRYPDALPGTLPEGLPNRKQAFEALETARQIFALVNQKLSQAGDPHVS
jgi:HEPN domain-containing protein